MSYIITPDGMVFTSVEEARAHLKEVQACVNS